MYIESSDLIHTPSFFLVALNFETDPNGRASCRSFHLEWCRAAGQGGCFPAAYLMAQELKWGSGGQGGVQITRQLMNLLWSAENLSWTCVGEVWGGMNGHLFLVVSHPDFPSAGTKYSRFGCLRTNIYLNRPRLKDTQHGPLDIPFLPVAMKWLECSLHAWYTYTYRLYIHIQWNTYTYINMQIHIAYAYMFLWCRSCFLVLPFSVVKWGFNAAAACAESNESTDDADVDESPVRLAGSLGAWRNLGLVDDTLW